MAHGHVRATKDLYLWVRPEKRNAERVLQALTDFGAPLGELTADDLTRKETIFQIGLQDLADVQQLEAIKDPSV